jgi:uncharacterized protein YegJ (DUF2314 family)
MINDSIFITIANNDRAMKAAHSLAANTIDNFIEIVKACDSNVCLAKLRFRDPIESQRSGRDELLYLWLADVLWHEDTGILSGVFFEVPEGLNEYHNIGQRLGFNSDDVFDWMAIYDGGIAKGGYGIQVLGSRMSNDERMEYYKMVGVSKFI